MQKEEGRGEGLKGAGGSGRLRPVSWSSTGLEFVYAII